MKRSELGQLAEVSEREEAKEAEPKVKVIKKVKKAPWETTMSLQEVAKINPPKKKGEKAMEGASVPVPKVPAREPDNSGPPPPPLSGPPPPITSPTALPLPIYNIFNAKDLKFNKKRLRKAEEILKQVDVERADVFDKFKKYNCMPLVDSREYLRTLRAEIKAISFEGVEQLTDAFLFSLHHCKLEIKTLSWVSLAGCYNITDEGIYWLTMAFKDLKSVSLMGCRNLTERSIHYLLKSSKKLQRILMAGTNVGMLPIPEPGCHINVDGCPVVSPVRSLEDSPKLVEPSKYRKLVIITSDDLPWNPLAILTNQKPSTPTQEFLYKPDWMLFDDKIVGNIKSTARVFNVFQIPDNKGLAALVLSPGSIVILPYLLHNKISVETTAARLAQQVASILTKCRECTFVLLGMTDGVPEITETKREKVYAKVKSTLKLWFDRLQANLKISIHTNWRMASLDFYEQEVLAAGESLIREGKKLYKDQEGVEHSLLSSVLNVGAPMLGKQLFLVQAIEADEQNFPWNRQAVSGQQVHDIGKHLQKSSLFLTPLTDVCKLSGCKLDSQGRELHGQTDKLVELATLWGSALHYPTMKDHLVISDFPMLADVFNKIFLSPAPRSANIRCLGKIIPCWTPQDFTNMFPKNHVLLLKFLEKHGYVMKIACDPWTDLEGVTFVYVLYKDFPDQPAGPLEEVWPEETNPMLTTQKDKFYFCCPGLPESFFPNLLRHVCKLGGHVLMWKKGVVIQKGFISLLIELIHDNQGLPVVVIQARMTEDGQKAKLCISLWMTFKIYTTIMDYLVLKYNICAAKSIPCSNSNCITTNSRYKILASKENRNFFLEHLVRVGEQRDIRCKVCEAGSIGYVQIGPKIQLSSLVPYHNQRGAALGTTNVYNRCLMCENCAVDGIECPVNLTQGIGSWYCGCNRIGNLCTNCGMCRRCFLYLKKIISTLEPCFGKPKLEDKLNQEEVAALDKVTVTMTGSFIGFIETNSRLELDHKMTPNYFPSLEVRLIEKSSMHIILEMSPRSREKSTKRVIMFDTQSGVISDRTLETTSQDAGTMAPGQVTEWPCRQSDRINVNLRYCKGGCTEMTLTIEVNSAPVYSANFDAQEVSVAMESKEDGVFVQLSSPEKYQHEASYIEARHRFKNCGWGVNSLTSSMEMKMYQMLDNIEEVAFGGRGISLTGAACIVLPSEITMEKLTYPHMGIFQDMSYHHLCLAWNPRYGKHRQFKRRFHGVTPGESEQPESSDAYTNNYDTWNLNRQIHLLNAEGIQAKDAESIDRNCAFLLWTWQYLIASYPKILLPDTTDRLLPPGLDVPGNQLKIEEGLRQMLRLGFWKYFQYIDFKDLETLYKPSRHGHVEFLTNKNKLVTYALVIQDLLTNNVEKTGIRMIQSRFNAKNTLYMCHGHCNTIKSRESLSEISLELYGSYAKFLSFIDVSNNNIVEFPDGFFQALPNLVDLSAGFNHLQEIPASIKHCRKLYSLSVLDNNLEDLPPDLAELSNLSILEIGNNRMDRVPDVVTKLTNLINLGIPNNMLTELPEDLGNLVNLKRLYLQSNCLTALPASFAKLSNLEELYVGGVPWVKVKSSNMLSFDGFRYFLSGKKMDRWLEANNEDKEELFHLFDENGNGVLELKELGKLNAAVFNIFPRFGYKGKATPGEGIPSGFPKEILQCTTITRLDLTYQGFVTIPAEIGNFVHLVELLLGHNPNLLSIPAEIGQLKTLKQLDLEDCPLLKTPPKEIRDKGFQSTFAYLRRLLSGALLSKRTKLMLVGLGGAGKTSLVRALMSDKKVADLQHAEAITDGIDIHSWKVKWKDDQITYNVWDFAGQTVYYNTHQFFLSSRAVYLLLWNVRLGYEHAGLDFWLSSISVQAPKAPIFVVGSHIDQVNKTEIPTHEMLQRYPQIAGFHFISSFSGQGIPELEQQVFDVTLQQKYMGEHIPAVWLTFENNIAAVRNKENIITYSHVERIANLSGIFDTSEIFQAVQFLHDLGSVQHFTNDYLKSKVVINPQWIVDVMACVVSVKTEVIKEGRLHHQDISEIWSDYPKQLHDWLLKLTEAFDLTFPLSNQSVNLVPCLLPEKKPEFVFPELERGSDIRENKMVYKFDYLPAGLFNRGQVRLHQLSDSALIWKKGSFLKKNVHIALLEQTRDSELVVTVQGPRPENILFLVHEVFEGLIAESFNGVTYDFSLPCPDCARMAVKDHHMFAASTIRRAIDMQAPFLQCIKYFHTISCADLLTLLPPDSHSDFDAHLVQSVQGLRDLRKALSTDIFISYCHQDRNMDSQSYILPRRVSDDLTNKGYRCWFAEDTSSYTTDQMAKALIDSSVFLAFVSANYAADDDCVNIFKYARLTLRKAMVVVAIGDGFEWKQSKIGILLSDEVYVNMTKPKFEHYDSKLEELVKALGGKTRIVADIDPTPTCFFSYTWTNSAEAVALGTRTLPGAVGYGDPREMKRYLEEHGVSCWIDVERVGMNGLFDDIAEGLLSAKVVIVCVSDEYANSPTCQIEFRYAANTLKLPFVMATVGTGDAWRATEVGLLSVHYPIVNFQEKTKNARKKLLRLVKERLGDTVDAATAKLQQDKVIERNKDLSYQELFELAQRKLLRQLTIYAENQDLDIYPRLMVADFVREDNKDDTTELPTDEEEDEDAGTCFDSGEMSETADASEKQVAADASKDKTPKPRLSQRQLSQKFFGKHSSTLHPAYKMQKFCVHILCEHDEGWHTVAAPLELPDDFGANHLDTLCPFLARMTTVLKYNKQVVLTCQEDEIGQDYIRWLEESPQATMSDYQTVYHIFREMTMTADVKRQMGKLARCHLPNGKTIWLCEKHRDTMRVRVLSNDEKVISLTKDVGSKMADWMVHALRTMDYSAFANRFKSSKKAKRAIVTGKPEYRDKKKKRKAHQERMKKLEEQEKLMKEEEKTVATATDSNQPTPSAETSANNLDEPDNSNTIGDQTVKPKTQRKPKAASSSNMEAQRQISKESVQSTTSIARQMSIDSMTSVSTDATSRQTSVDPTEKYPRTRRRQPDEISISSTASQESTASFRGHRSQGGRGRVSQQGDQRSRACVLS